MALETDFVKEFENFKKICLELKEKTEIYETRCLMLETEVDNLKKKNQELEVKIATIQKVIDDDNILNVIIENKVLESEKQKAESEVLFLKEKVKENEKVKEGINVVSNGAKQVRKRLFEEDRFPNKKMAPSTPGVGQSTFRPVIDMSDEDVEDNEIPKVKSQSAFKSNLQESDLEHMDELKVRSSDTRIAKRKRAANVITSDDDDDDDSYDDNATLSTLIKQNTSRVMTDSNGENVSRRRLTRLKKVESENKQENDVENDLESEDDSSDGFIDDSSQSVSVHDYKKTMDMLARKRSPTLKWVREGDMLSDFGKDLELCMSAVCALYRQQTDDEKETQLTIHRNGRGFSQIDATRGSELAVFLMGRDPEGDLNKTVEELNKYDREGGKKCRTLAFNYWKQLFKIYQNKEDPCFPPAPYR